VKEKDDKGNSRTNFMFQPSGGADSDPELLTMKRESIELEQIQHHLKDQQDKLNELEQQQNLQVLAESNDKLNMKKYIVKGQHVSDQRNVTRASLEMAMIKVERQKLMLNQKMNDLDLQEIDSRLNKHGGLNKENAKFKEQAHAKSRQGARSRYQSPPSPRNDSMYKQLAL